VAQEDYVLFSNAEQAAGYAVTVPGRRSQTGTSTPASWARTTCSRSPWSGRAPIRSPTPSPGPREASPSPTRPSARPLPAAGAGVGGLPRGRVRPAIGRPATGPGTDFRFEVPSRIVIALASRTMGRRHHGHDSSPGGAQVPDRRGRRHLHQGSALPGHTALSVAAVTASAVRNLPVASTWWTRSSTVALYGVGLPVRFPSVTTSPLR